MYSMQGVVEICPTYACQTMINFRLSCLSAACMYIILCMLTVAIVCHAELPAPIATIGSGLESDHSEW